MERKTNTIIKISSKIMLEFKSSILDREETENKKINLQEAIEDSLKLHINKYKK